MTKTLIDLVHYPAIFAAGACNFREKTSDKIYHYEYLAVENLFILSNKTTIFVLHNVQFELVLLDVRTSTVATVSKERNNDHFH